MEEAGGEDKGGGGGAPATFDTLIPQEFKDRQYLNDLKALPVGPDAYTALFKKLDGAQTLIGKKTGVPAADAPAEEWEKFHTALRPAKAEDYEIPVKEGQKADPEATKAIKGIFHEAGLTKAQAAKLAAKFDAFVEGKMAPEREAAAKLDKEFEEMTKAAFGAENAAVLSRSKELLAELTPDTLKPHLNRLPNESLVVLAGVMESIRAKYLGEDKMNGGNGAGGSPTDTNNLREEAQKLQASPAWKDTFHKDHAATVAKVNEIYTAVARVSGSGKK
jgi:hypothetical protein